jgi:molybdopterin-guanine dinucleotide biosynthesis protein A
MVNATMIRVPRADPGIFAGFVLVGGRSSRMGRDKALLLHHGEALASAIAREVERAAGQCTLIGDPSRYQPLGYPVIADIYPGEGPLGGILTALRHSSADWNVIVACDMPQITAELFRGLLEAADQRSDLDVLAPMGPSARFEPLCSVYHRRCGPVLQSAFDSGVRKIAEAVKYLRLETVEIPELRALDNVNTLEDWARYSSE